MEHNKTIIDGWFKAVLSLRNIKSLSDFRNKYPCKAYKFPELIELFKDESVSPENIMICLYKKGFIHINQRIISELVLAIHTQQTFGFNEVQFIIKEEETREFLTPPDNQLELDL